MKLGIIFALIAIPAVLLIISDNVDATCVNSAQPNANVCKGFSMTATTAGGVGSGRCFSLSVSVVNPLTCTTGGVGATTAVHDWQMLAGQCITMRYDDVANGGVPPAVPNKVSIDVRFDNTGTIIITLLSLAPEPANGATFTFCATDNGLVSGNPRAGTYKVLLTATKDNGVGGVGNYAVNSDGAGSASSFNKGSLQGQILVSSVARSAYPSGSMFAYGASGDETITITGTFTAQNGDAGVETARTLLIDQALTTTYQIGATTDMDSTTLAQSPYVVDTTFPITTANHYAAAIQFNSNSVLTGALWTTIAATGHGANIVADVANNVAYNNVGFTIDSRIRMDSDTTGGFATADETDRSYVGGTCSGTQIELFNRGEMACTAWSLVNARDEYLSRAMFYARYDFVPTLCASYGSLTPTANVYTISGSFSTSATCLAAADTTGSPRQLNVANTDQNYVSGIIYYISSRYFVDSHLQNATTLEPDNFPTEDSTETFNFTIRSDGSGGDDSDTIYLWCHVVGVRQDVNIDTSGTAVTRNIKDPTTATRASGTSDTGSDGWTPTSLNLLATTPIGDNWTGFCSVAFNGNTGSDTETFEVSVEGGGGTVIVEEILHVGDPLKVFCEYYALNESVLCTISESYLDGTARTGNAANTDVYLYAPDHTLVVNGDQPIEVAFGTYYYEYSNATEGTWLALIRTMNETGVDIGTSNLFTIDFTLLEHRETSLELFSMENIILLLFFGLLIIAEWKKDLIYHLLVVILGITLVSQDLTSGLRMVIVALMVYQIFRAYMLSKTARNTLENNQGD